MKDFIMHDFAHNFTFEGVAYLRIQKENGTVTYRSDVGHVKYCFNPQNFEWSTVSINSFGDINEEFLPCAPDVEIFFQAWLIQLSHQQLTEA